MKKMSNSAFLGIWIPVLTIAIAGVISANVLANHFYATLDTTFKKGEVIKTKLEGTEDWDGNTKQINLEKMEKRMLKIFVMKEL